ncbi:MAG: pyridoxal phosphate-dependent aminotransferase [Bacteroidales bacterium]|nr:pyridoxal phosphate-dependent aminotransferase [Bacteroidales bacterium]MBN2762654.1 pyridoxal phosphate-dependent aminotransferase [Bacteroidales bacterium]
MESLSQRVNALSPSATIAMNQRSRDLRAKGVDVINMGVGEPDFNTPDHIKEAAKKAIDDNFSFYPPVAGYPDLKKAIVSKFKRENDLDFTPEQILVSSGAKHSLANALMAIIDKGDEVIIPAPYWVSYLELVKLCEGKPVVIEAKFENDFKITPAQLQNAITPKTKAFMICSPSNPSGAVYSKDELKAFAGILLKHERIITLSDEIYEHINFVGRHESLAQFPALKERVVVINGVSKAYAMTGWRIGYMGAPLWITKACDKLQGQMTTGACTIAQKAAVAALTMEQQCVEDMREAFYRRKVLMVKLVRDIEGLKVYDPEGSFYVFPLVTYYLGKSVNGRTINNTTDLCLYLLEEAHISTVPGEAFGDPDCIRISFANSDENLIEAMRRMKEALGRMK